MVQDALQGQNISPAHDEVAGEGVAQDMRRLTQGEGDLCIVNRLVELSPAFGERLRNLLRLDEQADPKLYDNLILLPMAGESAFFPATCCGWLPWLRGRLTASAARSSSTGYRVGDAALNLD